MAEAEVRGDGADDRDHGRGKGDIVDKGARDGREPQNDDHNNRDIALTDRGDEVRDHVEHACLFKARHGNEQADEKEQRLIVHALNDFYNRFFAAGQAQNDQRQNRDDHADARDGKLRLRVRDEQHDRQQENACARKKCLLVRDGRRRLGTGDGAAVGMLGALKFLAEAEREVNEHEHKADRHDRAGIFDEVEECVAERGADDDVRRVAAHGRRAAEVRAEDLREDHRHGVELHRLRQFERDGGEKQHDRDAVDEHRQKRRERHKADEQRHRAVVYELGKRQAQPAEKARLAEALDHDHHAGDKQDR